MFLSIYLKRAILILAVMTFSVTYLTVTIYNRDFKSVFSCKNGKTVVIDPGHGDPDGGAVASDGTCEEEINLEISKKLRALLEEKCYNVIMTREGHEGIFSEGSSIKEKKTSDMHNREKIMNESGADIFLSVHLNKFTDPKIFGAQVFYSVNDPDSARLANLIQGELLKLDEKNKRVAKEAESSIYLMKKAALPALIVECGFLSNPEDANKLKDSQYQDKIASAIARGIEEYFNQDNELKIEETNDKSEERV